ncbi:MAG: cytidine deaminase [Clostridia bacterium]
MKQLDEQCIAKMLELAREVQGRAYVPYSNFRVGACLLGASGKYYLGCNIENAAYTPTNCAERTAVFKAVSEGEREFDAIAVVWDGEGYAMPCGVCRQVLAEFCAQDMPVICGNKAGGYNIMSMEKILPCAFLPKDLKTI